MNELSSHEIVSQTLPSFTKCTLEPLQMALSSILGGNEKSLHLKTLFAMSLRTTKTQQQQQQ
jgi:hypothetical protein